MYRAVLTFPEESASEQLTLWGTLRHPELIISETTGVLYMNNENIAEKNYLLSPKGLLIQPTGRSREMIYDYDRRAVPPMRRLTQLKEHDRYIVCNSHVMVELELAELGYAGALTASVVDLDTGTAHTAVLTNPLSFGTIELPPSPLRGDVIFRAGEEASADFSISTDKRYVRARIDRFDDVRSLYVNVTLEQPLTDAFCSLDSFTNEPECFRMGHRILSMPASGSVVYGADKFAFSAADSFGCLEWERAVLPRGSECCWYFMQGAVDGAPVTLTFASHSDFQRPDINAVAAGGTLFDPGEVRVIRSRDDEDDSVRLRSENGRIDLEFTPAASTVIIPAALKFALGRGERVFGTWSGVIRPGNGKPAEIEKMAGFIEKRRYRW